MTNDHLVKEGRVRTPSIHCHHCNKYFIASLDYSINGNHIIECPHCTHEHCRKIENGKVTGERWDSRLQRVDVPARYVWSHNTLPITTTTAAHFIRERWANRSDAPETS